MTVPRPGAAVRALGALALSCLALACGGTPERVGEGEAFPVGEAGAVRRDEDVSAQSPAAAAAPDPFALDLAGVEPAARREIEAARLALREALAAGEPQPTAAAYGALGRLYHAYEIADVAAECYRQAARRAPGDAEWPYLLALVELDAGRAGAAVAALRRALGEDEAAPIDLSAAERGAILLRLGEALIKLGKGAESEARFRQALTADPAFEAAARYGIGRALAIQGEVEGAIAELEKARDLAPGAGVVRYALALALRRAGRVDEARELLARGSAGAVPYPDPWADAVVAAAGGGGAKMRLGGEALMSGDLQAAVAAYREAVAADPGRTEPRRNLALALGRLGRHEEARAVLEEALALAPDDAWLRSDLGVTLAALGDVERAVVELERAVAAAPGFAAARFNLANNLMRLGRWEAAASQLERLLELDPHHAEARYLLAMSELQRGAIDEAAARLERLLAERPGNAPALQGLAVVASQRGDGERALELYEESLAAGLPADQAVVARTRMAELELARGRTEQALASYRAAAAAAGPSSPAAVPVQLALGQLLLRLRRFGEAAEAFGSALAIEPGDANARLFAAVAASGAGRDDEARRFLEEGLAALPGHVALGHLLARLLATSPDPEQRDGRRALELAERSYRAQPNVPHAETVAMALAESGEATRAAEWLGSLLARVEESGNDALATRLRADLEIYRRGGVVRRSLADGI